MRRITLVGLALAVSACHPTAAPPTVAVGPEPVVPRPQVDAAIDSAPIDAGSAPDVDEAACAGQDGLVATPRGPILAHWNQHLSVGGDGELEIRWCGAGAVEVRTVEVGDRARWQRTFDAGQRPLVHGQAAIVTVHGRGGPSRDPATVIAVDDAGGEHRAEATLISVDDPARVAARAACTACRGTWGAVGLAATETCDCPTADAGQRCTTSADCASVCIATGWTQVKAPPADACARGERFEQLVGRCHGRQHAFGCRPIVDEPQTRCVAPHHLADRLPMVCVD